MTYRSTIDSIFAGTDAIFPADTDFLREAAIAEAGDSIDGDTLLFLTKRSDGSPRELTLGTRPYAIVCEEDDAKRFPEERLILTENVRRTLAIAYSNITELDHSRIKIIAVTGTNGKTTVSEMLFHILRHSGADVGYIGTGVIRINETVISDPYYSMTTPDPRVLYPALRDMQLFGCTHVVMEVTSHAIALEKVAPIHFEYGLFTNLSKEHRDFHTDMESYFNTKLSLFESCERGLFNLDCRYSARAAALAKCKTETVGVLRPGDVYATDIIDKGLGGSSFFYREEGLIFGVDLTIPGPFNVYNALMAIRCAIALGIKPCTVKRGINSLSGIDGRMEIIRGDVTVVIDYAHTPDAVKNTLNSLFSIKRARQRLHLVIGCGGEREKSKRREIGKIAEKLCDGIYLTEDNSRTEPLSEIIADILSGISEPDGVSIVYSRAEAIERAVCEARSGDIVAILGKGREPYLIGPEGVREFSDRREAQRALRLRKAKKRIILDVPLGICDILSALGIDSRADGIISAVCTDSREVEYGDLFFPLAKNDDERVRHSAEARGRGGIVIGEQNCKPTFTVSSTRRALLRTAELYLNRLPLLKRRVGITGSVGKTTVTRYVSRLLAEKWRVHSTLSNFNNAVGLSLSILSAPLDTEVILLEMGMNARGEIGELAAAVRPNLALITNIGTAHIGKLGSRAAIAGAKLEIVADSTRTVILPFGEPLLSGVRGALTFGSDPRADIRLDQGGRAVILPFGRVALPDAVGEHTELNLCAAVGAAYALGLTAEEIALGLTKINENDSRARVFPLGELTVIDDSYNSSPEAVRAMLDLFRHYRPPYSVLLSDMLELGNMSESLHRDIGIYAARAGVSQLLAVGKYSACVRGGAIGAGLDGRGIRIYPKETDMDTILCDVLSLCKRGTLLIKGSHATGLHKIAEELRKSGEQND